MFYTCDTKRNQCFPVQKSSVSIQSDIGGLLTYRQTPASEEKLGYKDLEACKLACHPRSREKKSYETLVPVLPMLLPYLPSSGRVSFPQVSRQIREESLKHAFDIEQVTDTYRKCFSWMTSPKMSQGFAPEDQQAITKACLDHTAIWLQPFLDILKKAFGSSRSNSWSRVWYALPDTKQPLRARSGFAYFEDAKGKVQIGDKTLWNASTFPLHTPFFFHIQQRENLPVGAFTRIQFLDAITKRPLAHRPYKVKVRGDTLQLTFRSPI
jgi:hypothetical protein